MSKLIWATLLTITKQTACNKVVFSNVLPCLDKERRKKDWGIKGQTGDVTMTLLGGSPLE